jgi:hypothetical protein
MERAALPLSSPATAAFVDGLGERRQIVDPTGNETIELLCLRTELAAVPSFEFALRERVSRLASFRHASYGRVRSVERLADRETALAVVSDYTEGDRLSDMLVNAEERRLGLDINIALCLIRQLVPAVAMLHESGWSSRRTRALSLSNMCWVRRSSSFTTRRSGTGISCGFPCREPLGCRGSISAPT